MPLTYEVRDGVALLGFNRPDKHNAFRDEDLQALSAAVRRLDVDGDAMVGVLFGHGPSFSSGGDVSDRLQRSVDEGSTSGRSTEREAFLDCENWKPIIAAVHGYCLGHALSTALLCDHLVADETATFQLTETRLGLALPDLLPLLGSPAFANDVAMTGRMFGAEEAAAGGMVTRLVGAGEHLDAATALAAEILENPQEAVRTYVRTRRTTIAEHTARLRDPSAGADWAASAAAKAAVSARVRDLGRGRDER